MNVSSIRVRREWNCSLSSISYCWQLFSSTISYLLSLFQPGTLLACSLNATPCRPVVVLQYYSFSRYSNVRLKLLSSFLFVLSIIVLLLIYGFLAGVFSRHFIFMKISLSELYNLWIHLTSHSWMVMHSDTSKYIESMSERTMGIHTMLISRSHVIQN